MDQEANKQNMNLLRLKKIEMQNKNCMKHQTWV